jgi:hypothetical protein
MDDLDRKVCPMPEMEYCLKEKCAWWDGDYSRCSIRSLARWTDELIFQIREIRHGLKVYIG